MKELSIEEKAQRYDEVWERAKNFIENGDERERTIAESIFAGIMEESEDERIRKDIVFYIAANHKDDGEKARWLYWLEKQGEQKPTENKRMNLVEEEMTPFQKEVFCIIDTTIEEERGLKQVCDELLRLAHDEIMQKPAWSEDDELHVNSLLKRLEGLCRKEFAMTRFAINEDEDWLKSLRPQSKQEWSEEDEAIYYGVIETEQYMLDVVNGIKKFDVGNISIKEECTRELNWLKSIKDRIHPKQEWSEENERLIEEASEYLREYANQVQGGNSKVHVQSIADRVESLRPQKQWKPSEEMLEALYRATPENVMEKSEDEILLDKLYQGLKYGKVLSKK